MRRHPHTRTHHVASVLAMLIGLALVSIAVAAGILLLTAAWDSLVYPAIHALWTMST